MIIVAKDVIHDVPEVVAAQFVDAGGGYEALQLANGHFVTRTNDGQWHTDATEVGAWERCKRSGQIVSWNGAGNLTIRSWAEA